MIDEGVQIRLLKTSVYLRRSVHSRTPHLLLQPGRPPRRGSRTREGQGAQECTVGLLS